MTNLNKTKAKKLFNPQMLSINKCKKYDYNNYTFYSLRMHIQINIAFSNNTVVSAVKYYILENQCNYLNKLAFKTVLLRLNAFVLNDN